MRIPPIRRLAIGYCPICQATTVFIALDAWLRDHYRCVRCRSIPRWRALIDVLESLYPKWREMQLHEAAPGGAASTKLAQECRDYVATHWFSNVPVGHCDSSGIRCENLEQLTFEDDRFDLVVTQDVFEHVLHPDRAFKEVARTLRVGGAHVFTVPWYFWKETQVRAQEINGQISYLAPPEFHGNPIDTTGSLVVTEWGYDMIDFIYRQTDLTTTVVRTRDRQRGIEGEFVEVFVSRKIHT
jgi:hypothetical protein